MIRDLWWAMQRSIDLRVLWPECKRQARSLDVAKHAFMVHAVADPAWSSHYGDRLWEVVNSLE